MKKQDFVYLFLSLVLLALSGYIYVTFGDNHIVTKPPKPKTVQVTKPTEKKEDKQEEAWTELAKKLDELEKNPNGEALATLKPELEALKASTHRDALIARFDRLSADLIRIAEAEAAMQASIDNPSQENIAYTQELIDQVQTPSKKEDLQNRLNTLATEGFSPATPASSSSEEAAAAPATQTTPATPVTNLAPPSNNQNAPVSQTAPAEPEPAASAPTEPVATESQAAGTSENPASSTDGN